MTVMICLRPNGIDKHRRWGSNSDFFLPTYANNFIVKLDRTGSIFWPPGDGELDIRNVVHVFEPHKKKVCHCPCILRGHPKNCGR
jgi:hypothetical protein